jgi:hypothetical protein
MPTQEPVAPGLAPKVEEKEIPVRVVSTKTTLAKTQENQSVPENKNQTIHNETAAPEASGTTEESVKLSPQISALARKEQAFRQREIALKQREKDLELDLASAREFKELKEKLSAKDFSQAEKLGLNYDEYVKYKIDQVNGEDPNAQALKKLEGEIESLKKGQEESAQQEFEETVLAYKKEILAQTANNPEFAGIKKLGAEQHVLQLILDSWEEDGIELSVQDACKDVVTWLKAQSDTLGEVFKPVEEPKKLPPPRPGVKTLTNDMRVTGKEAAPQVPLHKLSEAERFAEARRRVMARRQQQG